MNSKKFYKIQGAHNIFDTDTRTVGSDTYVVYNTISVLNTTQEVLDGDIDEETILFVTCDNTDVDRYLIVNIEDDDTTTEQLHKINEYNTFIWAKGDVYSLSKKTVTNVEFSGNDLVITYSDLSTETLPSATGDYSAGVNISINNRTISATGYSIDSTNSVLNSSINTVSLGSSNCVALGSHTTASGNGQTVIGKYNTSDAGKVFIIGNGTAAVSNNLFTIDADGIVLTSPSGDFKIDDDTKLSDIHKVVDSDWGAALIDNSDNKKFALVEGLHNIFSKTDNIYDTTVLKDAIGTEIGENTIVFIIADSTDAGSSVGTYSVELNDTFIWAKGSIFSIYKSDAVTNTWRPVYINNTSINDTALNITAGTDISITTQVSNVDNATSVIINAKSDDIKNKTLAALSLTSPDSSIIIEGNKGAWSIKTASNTSVTWGIIE